MPRKRVPYFEKWPTNNAPFVRVRFVETCAELGRDEIQRFTLQAEKGEPLPEPVADLIKIHPGVSLVDSFYQYKAETQPVDKLKLWIDIFASLQLMRPYSQKIDEQMTAPGLQEFFINAFNDFTLWQSQYLDSVNIVAAAQRADLGLKPKEDETAAAESMLNNISAEDRKILADKYNLEKLETVSDLAGLSLEVIDRIKNGYDPTFSNIPNTEQSNLIERALSAGSDFFPEMATRLEEISHGKKDIVILEKRGTYIIKQTTENNETEIQLDGFSSVLRRNKNTKKFFDFALSKVNERINKNALQEKTETPQAIPVYISLEELVSCGMYSSLRAARRGFDEGTEPLRKIFLKYKKTGETNAAGWAQLFAGVDRENNVGVIYVFKSPVWGDVFEQYTFMPKWAFALSSRGYDLFRLIISTARRNGAALADKGYINISLRNVQAVLCLPDERETKNPQKDIKQPIDKAIEDIEDCSGTTNLQFELLPNDIDDKPIKEYLDTGILRVYMSGQYKLKFTEMARRRERIIENKKRAKRKAIAKQKAESKD